jgi:D-3-phosphoglycerate dehydrogenase
MHILIADGLPPAAVAIFTAEGWTVDPRTGRSTSELRHDISTAAALIVRSATRVDDTLLDAAPTLRVIARAGVGIDNVDLDAAARRGIVVMNTPDATTISVAELTIAGLLALARRTPAADRSMKAGRWDKVKFAGAELAGTTLGIVGFGRIGRRVGRLALAFDITVVACDPAPGERVAGVTMVSLDELCAVADFITLHAPASPATHHLFDAARWARCKRGVRIVNTARGELIDEAALLAALTSGHVAGAALDVFDPEPPSDRALVTHEAVIATPHIGASTVEAQRRAGVETARAVRDFLLSGVARNALVPPRR